MKTVQSNLPSRVHVLLYPTHDDYERAKNKARELLRSVLPIDSWIEFETRDVIQYAGKRGTYVISPYSQTEIRDSSSDRCVAYACLHLSIPAPTYDRMVAEYLLIRNAEDVYWKTANIFSWSGNEFNIVNLFLAFFDVVAFTNLLITVLSAR